MHWACSADHLPLITWVLVKVQHSHGSLELESPGEQPRNLLFTSFPVTPCMDQRGLMEGDGGPSFQLKLPTLCVLNYESLSLVGLSFP